MSYTLQQNDIAKRRNMKLMEMARSMISYSDLPLAFWGDTLSRIMYILNRVTIKSKILVSYDTRKLVIDDRLFVTDSG